MSTGKTILMGAAATITLAGVCILLPGAGQTSGLPTSRSAPAEAYKPVLTLELARTAIEAATAEAARLDAGGAIAVVDDGGHLVAFVRMDGARPASGYTALTKAVAAATFRQETGPLPAKGQPDLLLSLSLQSTALAGGGKGTALKGGAPILIDGQVAGAVGV